jgi:hypothetical protein
MDRLGASAAIKGASAFFAGALVEIGLPIAGEITADGEDGEFESLTLRFSALAKLHFFEGVFGLTGSCALDGPEGDGMAVGASKEIVRSALVSSTGGMVIGGKCMLVDDWGGERKAERSLGSGGTGGTLSASKWSPFVASSAARSLRDATSLDCADPSLPALLGRPLPKECRFDVAETDVKLVAADIVPDSRELVVGVPV